MFLSAIAALEIELGALSIERKDKARGALLRTWIDDQVLPGFEGRILAVDAVVALRCARLHGLVVRSERDALTAATALVDGMKVVKRDVADFEPTGVGVPNPWR